MNEFITIGEDNLVLIDRKIKTQQKYVYHSLAFLIFICLCIALFCKKYEEAKIIFITFAITPVLTAFYPLTVRKTLLANVIYGIEKIDDNTIEFALYGNMDKHRRADIKDVKMDKQVLQKKLFKTFSLNKIFINGKEYRIFSSLSGFLPDND